MTHVEAIRNSPLVAVALIASALGLSFAGAQQKVRDETQGHIHPEFSAQHEIGRRFRIDQPSCLLRDSAIVTNRADRPLQRTNAAGPAGFHSNTLATGLVNQGGYSSCLTATFGR
jgi:hypothetical protein